MGGREQGTQRSRLPLPVGSGSLKTRKKKTSVALVKKLRRKKFTGSGGVPLFFRLTRSHAHVNKHLHGGGGGSSFNPGDAADSKVTTPTAFNKLTKREKTPNTA